MQSQLPANRLRELREARDLKLYDIAALVRADPGTISRWENGLTTTVRDDVKFQLAKFYGVSVPYLMGWDADEAAA